MDVAASDTTSSISFSDLKGAIGAGSNATSIQSNPVTSGTPTNGALYTYDTTTATLTAGPLRPDSFGTTTLDVSAGGTFNIALTSATWKSGNADSRSSAPPRRL